MSDLLIQELKTFEVLVQNMLEAVKRVEKCTSEIKQISTAIDLIAKNTEASFKQQEKMTSLLEQAWINYSDINKKLS